VSRASLAENGENTNEHEPVSLSFFLSIILYRCATPTHEKIAKLLVSKKEVQEHLPPT
jgi:hypothetical protein